MNLQLLMWWDWILLVNRNGKFGWKSKNVINTVKESDEALRGWQEIIDSETDPERMEQGILDATHFDRKLRENL